MVDSSHPRSMYGIGEQRGKAWLVNVQRFGVDYAKVFWFRTHGGRESALDHARAWRDAQLAQHPPISREQLARKVKLNNTSGYPGVKCRNDSNGKPQRWVAVTQISPEKTLVKSFSISRFGYEGARAMAIEERERQLEQMQGFVVRDPFAVAAVNREATAYPAPHLVPKQPLSMTPGVHLVRGRSGKPQSWVAQTQCGMVRERAAFSIAKYGEIRAKELALAERRAQLERVFGGSARQRKGESTVESVG